MTSTSSRDAISQLFCLRTNFEKCVQQAKVDEELLQQDYAALVQLQERLRLKQDELLTAQEEIDSCPLPAGAQPLSRLQLRDRLALEVQQLETQCNLRQQTLYSDVDKAARSKAALHQADATLSRFAETLKSSEAVRKAKVEAERER